MKLYDVVFTDGTVSKLKFVETTSPTNNKYKSIYVENDTTAQRYFLSKDVTRNIVKSRKDMFQVYDDVMNFVSSESGKDFFNDCHTNEVIVNTYSFNNLVVTSDLRNYNVVLDSNNENSDCDILSIAINNSDYQLVDYDAGGTIIQTSRRNGYTTCLISVPKIPDENAEYYGIGLILSPGDDYSSFVKYNIFISNTGVNIFKYDVAHSDPIAYINSTNAIATAVANSLPFFKNFKVSDVSGICTSIVLVNPKYIKDNPDGSYEVPSISKNTSILVDKANIVKCTDDMINSKEIDETLNNMILSNNVRIITSIGVKFNAEFYRKYRILYAYSYNPKTGISRCIKSN